MNSGTIIQFLAPRRFDYSYLTSGSQVITLVPALDTMRCSYLGLYVRVHQRDMISGSTFVFSMYNTAPSTEDSREFVDSTNSVLDVTVSSSAPTSAPGLRYDYTTRFGPFLKIVVTANQAVSGAGTLYAELSAMLELRVQ